MFSIYQTNLRDFSFYTYKFSQSCETDTTFIGDYNTFLVDQAV